MHADAFRCQKKAISGAERASLLIEGKPRL
jgi:hypothetical protein